MLAKRSKNDLIYLSELIVACPTFSELALLNWGLFLKGYANAASELGISKGSLHAWVNQDEIDCGQRPGLTTKEHAELVSAKRRIRELEMEIEIIRRASEIFNELNPRPKESCP